MTRVLNIISDSNIGGAGRVLLNYLQYADRQHYETHIAVPRGSLLTEPLTAAGGVVHEVDGIAERSYHKADVPLLKGLMQDVKPDLVHTHGNLSGRIAAKRCGVPVIFTRHSAFPVPAKLRYPPGRWVNKWLNEHYADRIIAVSPAAAKNLTDGGISPKKITTMMNGVAPLERISAQEQAALRKSLGVAQDAFLLGILARIEDYKGHLTIAEAVAKLKAQGYQLKVLVAGVGPYEGELRREIDRLGVSGELLFLGFRSDVAAILSVLDCQLNASYGTETSSLSLLEGMSMGLPAIVSDYGGNPFVIDDGLDGLLFPAKDSGRLAACIARVMDNRAELAAMGREAHSQFEKRFTGEIFAGNIEAVYASTRKGANT